MPPDPSMWLQRTRLVFFLKGTETKGEGHVEKETEIGMMWPQAKQCLEPPKAGRGEERSFPYGFQREHGPADDFGSLASRTVRQQVSVAPSHLAYGTW